MIGAALSRRAQALDAEGAAYVTATVVRAQRPTSVVAGDAALVLGDGTIDGFVGGTCAEHSVRAYALEAIRSGRAVLLRIVPDAGPRDTGGDDPGPVDAGPDGPAAVGADGAVTVQNPCLSGGALEVFLEPVLPDPRVLVVGDTPIAAALLAAGRQFGLDTVSVDGAAADPQPTDLALVVAAHGRDELPALRRSVEIGLAYVGLVASPRRGAGVLDELRAAGVEPALLARVDVPAGLDIGARTPAEIALSILAQVVAVRRSTPIPSSGDGAPAAPAMRAGAVTGAGEADAAAAPGNGAPPGNGASGDADVAALAVDPICGMTVAAVASTLSVQHDGESVYFCGPGCQAAFASSHEHAGRAD